MRVQTRDEAAALPHGGNSIVCQFECTGQGCLGQGYG